MVGSSPAKTRRLALAARGASARANAASAAVADGPLRRGGPSALSIVLGLALLLVLLLLVIPKYVSRPAGAGPGQAQGGADARGGGSLESVFSAASTAYKYHMQQREFSFARDRLRPEERLRWKEAKMREIFLVPTYSCPVEIRVGEWGEGGKWLCNVFPFRRQMRSSKRITGSSYHSEAAGPAKGGLDSSRPIVVYSVGSRDETSFEEAIFRLLNVRPHTMDPSLSISKQEHMKSLPFVHFHNIGLTGKVKRRFPHSWGPAMRLTEVMAMLNHTYIDVLKIDCEGCELDVMQDLLEQYSGNPPVGQVLMEIHHVFIPKVQLELLQIMEQLGFRMFHSENNERYLKAHETAYIHESLADPTLWPYGP